jgi:pre-mRNA-splicing factor 18
MDLLKKELERKRKTIDLAKKSNASIAGTTSSSNKRTYLKAGQLRKFQEEQDELDRNKRKASRGDALKQDGKKRRRDEFQHRGKKGNGNGNENWNGVTIPGTGSEVTSEIQLRVASGNDHEQNETPKAINDAPAPAIEESTSSSSSSSTSLRQLNPKKTRGSFMTSEEITSALRELGIPIHIFGERNDEQRFERLQEARESKKALMAGISENDDFKLGSGHGIRNPFLQKDKDGEKDLDQGMKKTSNKEVVEEEIDDDSDPHRAIHRFFKAQLKSWEDDLVDRPEAVKRTLQGKNETKTLKQCKDYIRPLFKLCKNRRLDENLTNPLLKIAKFCKQGEFVRANDVYIDVAIGRAAWPIGVTQVGIHSRTGRAKIESSNVAHVMNSEMQRKYLTSVKRLISFCQKKRTDVAPSKKVVNC